MDQHVTQNFCELQHKATNEKLDFLIKEIAGNGKEGLREKVSRHDMILKIWVWVVGILFTAVVGIIAERFLK